MIFDALKNCELYYPLHRNFEKAFDFIKRAVAENLPVGKYEIEGKDLYASISEYTAKASQDGKFEGHREYIDIQFIVSGTETMELVDITRATPNTEYNEVKDVEFYANEENATVALVTAGDYGIFYPSDIHKPGIMYKTPSAVKKIVVKVKL